MKMKIKAISLCVLCLAGLLSCKENSLRDYKGKPYSDVVHKGDPQSIPGKLQCEYYDFGGEGGLVKSRQKSVSFKKFNPEQQGNIVQSYYLRKRGNQDVSAWEPFIDELKA